jgi:hypothetical protein
MSMAMFDTVHLRLSQEQTAGNLLDCLPYLTDISETYKRDGGKFTTGHAGNFRIYISDYGINIKGSLAKYYLGTNLHTPTREECKRAFELLADTLHLPIQLATVSRIDIGMNLITQYKPEVYFSYLGQSNYYNRLTQPMSISYQNTQRCKKFYNKIAEIKSRRAIIPNPYQGKNMLRYELSYLKRLPKQFNRAIITPDTLIEEDFYINLFDRMVKEYEVIQKIGLVNMDISKLRSPKDFMKWINALAIQEKGSDTFLHLVDLLKEQNAFNKPEYYSRLRSEIIRQSGGYTIADTPELVLELNKKIAGAKESLI